MNARVTIRPASVDDSDALGLITVTASLGSFIGNVPEESLDLEWSPRDSATGWRAALEDVEVDELFLVAAEGDRVVGFVWAGPSRREVAGEGAVLGLYVLPSRQGRGIGRRLVSASVRELRRRRMSSLVVGCVAENPSCGFYRHLGGTEAFRRPASVDGHVTEEVFFAWSDSWALI